MALEISVQSGASQGSERYIALRKAASDLEVTFLDEMLKSAGFGRPQSTFGGGAGEEQFSSILRHEQARRLVDGGGIGLSATIFNYLAEKHDGATEV